MPNRSTYKQHLLTILAVEKNSRIWCYTHGDWYALCPLGAKCLIGWLPRYSYRVKVEKGGTSALP